MLRLSDRAVWSTVALSIFLVAPAGHLHAQAPTGMPLEDAIAALEATGLRFFLVPISLNRGCGSKYPP
jgi:hypothetical protein